MKKLVLRAVILIAGVFAVLGYWGWRELNTGVGGDAAAVAVVESGARLRSVLRDLHAQGVLEYPKLLYLFARATGQATIRTGEYRVLARQTPLEILAIVHEGRARMDTFTLVEGLNRWQVRDVLVKGQWISARRFEQLCDDPGFLAKNDIPGPTCEGYLFPETYTFARGVSAEKLFATLFAAYKSSFGAAMAHANPPVALTERERVTLASIVEKETGSPEERPRIACVFYNRLKATPKWRLETDPTVIYAATIEDPNFDGNITRAHLRKLDNPYNTYRVYGLPPGPIANPGRAALEAVAHPAACGDFFFVSMNNGKHVFCPTLDCHNKAVQKWQVDYFRRRR